MDEMKAFSSPVAELALWAAEAGSVAGAGTTIKSEGTKPKVLPIQDCLSSERGSRLSLFRKSAAFLAAIQRTTQPRSSRSCGCTLRQGAYKPKMRVHQH
jgi:hypothetical protein